MTTTENTTQTVANEVDLVIVGTRAGHIGTQGAAPQVIASLTPDLVLPDYLQSLEQSLGYTDVHVARRATAYTRLNEPDNIEALRSTYPDQHRHMAKTTRRVQR